MGLGRSCDEKRRRDLGEEGDGVERLSVERSPTSRGECLRKRRDAYVCKARAEEVAEMGGPTQKVCRGEAYFGMAGARRKQRSRKRKVEERGK